MYSLKEINYFGEKIIVIRATNKISLDKLSVS